jgi:glycosyltransferase involved in cell wall biosynthesis
MPSVSALISTYMGETSENLAQSLESIYRQTVTPDQVVLVVDGEIPLDQEKVIALYEQDKRVRDFTLLRLSENRGLAYAMNAGLELCTGDYTMRMDSDDICALDRLELQLHYMVCHPETDLISSWSEEFFPDGCARQIKVSPITHEYIAQALHWRNVLVHPSIVVRTSALRAVGGYRSKFPQLEDYDLFVRLILAGYKFHVIPRILVMVRSSAAQKLRRGGFRYCFNEAAFRFECWRSGFLKWHEFVATTSLYLLFRLVSGSVRKRIYAFARS